MSKTKRLQCVLLALIITAALFSACFFTACGDESGVITPEYSFEDTDFIKADGSVLRTDCGKGEVITLRGLNAGGVFVTENWMNAFDGSRYTFNAGTENEVAKSTRDNKTINEVFIDRFGGDKTAELWREYRNNYWSDIDFANCAAMGINTVRLPFTYMSVDPTYHQIPAKKGEKFNFDALDAFVDRAEEFGLYTVLDLHGAYGSQNGKDHSGEVLDSRAAVTFYEDGGAENRQKTAELWGAIAEHYNGRAAIAGYDLLNEPGERTDSGDVESTVKRHWDVLDMFYKAVREYDGDHVVIIESCWTGANLPQPSVYGWENVMYSFHHYTGDSNYDTHMSSMRERVSEVESRGFRVPLYMGEFTCYESERSWEDTLKLFDERGWNWTAWTYKTTPSWGNAWGVYCLETGGQNKISPTADSFETLMTKFAGLRTVWAGYEGTPVDFKYVERYRDLALASAYKSSWGWEKTTAQIIYETTLAKESGE